MANPPKKSAKRPEPELSPKMFVSCSAVTTLLPRRRRPPQVVPALLMVVKFFKLDFTLYVPQLRAGYACGGRANKSSDIDVRPARPEEARTGRGHGQGEELPEHYHGEKFTVADYDQREATSKLSAVPGGRDDELHAPQWGSPMPLLFQCVMLPMNLADEPLVKIHVFGAPRPVAGRFAKPPNPLADALGVNPDADDGAVAPTFEEGRLGVLRRLFVLMCASDDLSAELRARRRIFESRRVLFEEGESLSLFICNASYVAQVIFYEGGGG